eukprot:1157675-Pelagomonas_calceolata.AAC.4
MWGLQSHPAKHMGIKNSGVSTKALSIRAHTRGQAYGADEQDKPCCLLDWLVHLVVSVSPGSKPRPWAVLLLCICCNATAATPGGLAKRLMPLPCKHALPLPCV